jgi:conjugal transfer/type IV secretion protein DotA/TraY
MRLKITKPICSPSGGLLTAALAVILTFAFIASPTMAAASPPTPGSMWDFFGTRFGDPYSSVFLNQMFGPLFESASGSNADSLFAQIIAYFNVIILLVGGLMFFYNVTVGVLQSAHEGQVLGQRWSSLWAPLRVIFAVGMLVPVNQGYNLGQSGVAYIVKGSTMMASSIWGASATAVIDGDIPLSAPTTQFDTDTLAALYEQAACMTALTKQVKVANPNATVEYVHAWTNNVVSDSQRLTYSSAINNGSGHVDHNVCGSWRTPPIPAYIQKIIDGSQTGIAADTNMESSTATAILDRFNQGHRDIMLNAADGMRKITDDNYDAMMASDIQPPSIANDIASIHTTATLAMESLNTDIRNMVTSDTGVTRSRDALLNRINGSASCFDSSGGLSNVNTERAASVACYGEGWMGAGSWYILMAKINNELASLTEVASETSKPTYGTGSVWPKRIFRSAGGEGSGWLFNSITAEDVADMPSVAQSVEALEKYQGLFETSVMELAALGWEIPTNILNEMTRDMDGDNESFWSTIMPDEMMASGTRAMMNFFDPGKTEADPMIGLIEIGKFLINIGSTILIATAATGFFTGGGAAVALLPVYSLFLSAGVTLSFILPIMPFLYWVLAISGYFLLIVEAIIAVNLWALSHLRMDGEGFSGEGGRLGWMMILSLFMTPTLMVFGFLIGMTLFRIVSDLISAGLFYAVSSILNANPFIWLFGTLGYTVLTVTAYGLLLERSFSLVSEFPSRVMKWMGQQVDLNNGEARIQAAAAAGALGVNSAGNMVEKGRGQTTAQGKFVKGSGLGGRLRSMGEKKMPGLHGVKKGD